MIGVEPSSIYVGRNTSDGTPARLLPFKPSPDRTHNGRKLFKALNNTTLVASDQAGTPYQFSFIVSLFNSIGVVSLYNNTNANITFDVTLNLSGTVTFTVTDINGSTAITTTQALEVGWSYELTFQYTYNGEFIPITYFLRSVFMNIFINGRLANRGIDFDGSASIAPAAAASTLTITSSANTYVAAIAQWWSAWWISLGVAFAWQWWKYWWSSWWRSRWWRRWRWWRWSVWWNCVLTGCSPTTNCGPNACHGAAPFDQLYRYNRLVGDIDFVLAGVGIRDYDTNVDFAIINIDTGPTATSIVKVYLYWNTIGSDINCPKTAIIDLMSVTGDIIGCTGNACWGAFCVNNGDDSIPEQPDQNILNKVWFKDITSLGLVPTGPSSHTISIPTVFPGAFLNKQGVRYPGCQGGQGIALLVIYATPPKSVTRPLQRCCKPVAGMVTERETKEIIIWHGAKLLCPGSCSPPTVGGSPSYTIPWKTKYTWNPKLATAVGDPQKDAPPANSLVFNSTVFLPQPKYFSPIDGNLLQVKTEYPPAHSAICDCGKNGRDNTITASTTSDCLNWFLFVWSASIKCTTPVISSSSQSFSSPPTMAMSLWNPNPPDCCPVRLPCCGDICLPAKLNVVITAQSLECTCFATQVYTMSWDKNQQKYIFQNTTVCGCTLFGWLYCVGSQWTLYLALYSGVTLCSDGMNSNFPINCSPFGGFGSLVLSNIDEECPCSCLFGTLSVNISTG